jgi:hypothetical protein
MNAETILTAAFLSLLNAEEQQLVCDRMRHGYALFDAGEAEAWLRRILDEKLHLSVSYSGFYSGQNIPAPCLR